MNTKAINIGITAVLALSASILLISSQEGGVDAQINALNEEHAMYSEQVHLHMTALENAQKAKALVEKDLSKLKIQKEMTMENPDMTKVATWTAKIQGQQDFL
jgi:hypothetical protein